jgi:hypothetical protein
LLLPQPNVRARKDRPTRRRNLGMGISIWVRGSDQPVKGLRQPVG